MLDIEKLLTKCQDILNTLPIAHYLKVKTIPVEFDIMQSTSYFDPVNYKIVVAFNNVASALKSKRH